MLIALLAPVGLSAQDNEPSASNRTFSQEELAQMLAPVALYPDALLTQILMAAAYPFEVVEAERWVTNNPFVTGDALDEALQAKDWDVSVLALCHYPKVLTMMTDNLSWTAALGDAFVSQEEDVMDTVQELRARANEAGNLSTTDEQRVIIEDRIIRIEPYSYDYLYIPAYDPYYVYGSWWLPMFPPFAIFLPGLFVSGPGLIFSPRVEIGFGVFGWSYFNWGGRHVVITDIHKTRRFNRHYHIYRETDRRRWSPDRNRRVWYEKRRSEIPRFHPPAAPGDRWDRPSESGVKAPGGRTVPHKKPRITDGHKRPVIPGDKSQKPEWNQPRIQKDRMLPGSKPPVMDKGKSRPSVPDKGDKGKPGFRDRDKIDRPHGIETGKTQPIIPKTMDQGQPVIHNRDKMTQPLVIDRGKSQPEGPATVGQGQPVVRDQGGPGVQRYPGTGQKGIERNPPVAPRGSGQGMPRQPSDRWDRQDQGGIREGGRK